ncbi:MAG: ornithine cyclodeaminase family protein [Armatimonadetes bacterium]|nr:ornithine cyclodeaminase family protein [Armatimonadota bacterium]
MKVLHINYKEVRRLLPMEQCIEEMSEVLKTFSDGDVVMPLRSIVWHPDKRGALGVMPAYLGNPELFGIKIVTVFPGNEGTDYESHQGAVMLFDAEHGRLLAIIDGGEITTIRTAAVSAVATRVLARKDARDLAIIGSGTQARSHLQAMAAVRDLRRIRVWSRNRENAQHFAEWARPIADVEVAQTARGAVEGADIICTVTGSKEPVIQGEWISPGSHINAVGACVKVARELDSAAVARSRLFVDCRESAFNESGDILIPRQEGLFGDDHVRAELGEVLAGRAEGRESDEEVTLFKSLGIAVEDLAAAHYIYRRAQAENIGLSVELGGLRHGAS